MAIKMDNYGNVYDDQLFHYGKKGMKWGKHVMAQEKYWISGNGRNLGGDMNSRMAADTSGIKWKRTVAPSGGFKPSNVRTVSTNTSGQWESLNSRNPSKRYPHWYSMTDKTHSITNLSAKKYLRKNALRKDANLKYISKKTGNPVVPTSNPAVKGVNTTPQGGFGAKTMTSKKAEMLKNKDTMHLGGVDKPIWGAKNALLFNSSVSNRVGSTMKKSISSIQKDQSGLLYKAKKTVNRIFKKISKFFGW